MPQVIVDVCEPVQDGISPDASLVQPPNVLFQSFKSFLTNITKTITFIHINPLSPRESLNNFQIQTFGQISEFLILSPKQCRTDQGK